MVDPFGDGYDLMEYRGYKDEIEYDPQDDELLGHVVNLQNRDLVLIGGRSGAAAGVRCAEERTEPLHSPEPGTRGRH